MKCDKCGNFINDINSNCPKCTNTSSVNVTTFNDLNGVDSKLSKKKFFIFKIILFIIILISFLVSLYFIFNRPVYIYKSYLNVFRNNFLSDVIPLNIRVSLNSKSINNENYDKVNLNFDIYENIDDNLFFLNFNGIYNNNSFLNFSGLLDRKSMYLDLKNTYDKMIYINFNDDVYSYDGIISILDSVIYSFKGSLRDEYFIKYKDSILIDNIKYDVNSNVLIINNDNYKYIVNSMVKYLRRDENFLNNYAKLSGKEIYDIIAILNNYELSNISNYEFEYKIILYSNNFSDVIGIKILDGNNGLFISFVDEKIIVKSVYDGVERNILDINNIGNKYEIKFYNRDDIYLFDVNYEIDKEYLFTKPSIKDTLNIDDLTSDEISNIFNSITTKSSFINLKNDFSSVIEDFNVLFNKNNSFNEKIFYNDLVYIFDEVNKHYINHLINNVKQNVIYTNVSTIPGRGLINKDGTYYVKIDSDGNVIKFVYFNNNFCFDSESLDISIVTKDSIISSSFLKHNNTDSYNGCG